MYKLIALLLLTAPAHADPDRLSLLIGSAHVGGVGFDGRNPGIFATWEDRALGLDYSLGAYRNSYGRASVVATAALPVIDWRDGALSVFAGAAFYPGDGRRFAVHLGDVVPIGGVQIRHHNMFLQIMPSDGAAVDAVIAGGITWEIGQ